MIGIELFKADGTATGIFYCESCRVVHRGKYDADRCCVAPVCQCGKTIDRKYHMKCSACEDKAILDAETARFEKAEKLATWDGPVFAEGCGSNEGYFSSMDDFLDWTQCREPGEEVPHYVWTCDKVPVVKLDLDHILESATEEAYEDFSYDDLDGIPALQAAVDLFCEINKDVVNWMPNYTRVVVLKDFGLKI